jgi:hypothetical protein
MDIASPVKSGQKRTRVRLKVAPPRGLEGEEEGGSSLEVPPLTVTFSREPPKNLDALDFECRATTSGGGKRQRVRLRTETDRVEYQVSAEPACTIVSKGLLRDAR